MSDTLQSAYRPTKPPQAHRAGGGRPVLTSECGTPVTPPRRPDDHLTRRHARLESWLSLLGAVATLAAFGAFAFTFGDAVQDHLGGPASLIKAIIFLAIVASLVYGGVVYLSARAGYMRRRRDFRHAPTVELEDIAADGDASVCVLVPSYKEELSIVRQTLLSAALQEYSDRRIVLLIDDPPQPSDPQERAALRAARRLPGELQRLLAAARAPLSAELRAVEARAAAGSLDVAAETRRLALLYSWVAAWFNTRARSEVRDDHTDSLFVDMCLRQPSARHAATADGLRLLLSKGGPYPSRDEILRHHRRLDSVFAASLTSFERKRYVNLSHAPNKAMNLNSYIALMGRHLVEQDSASGPVLHDVPPAQADLHVPAPDFILTLDADSLLDPSYMGRLVHLLQDERHARVAVAQTPYSAVPGATRSTERIAGATTDLQYVIHQGLTAHGATYWVGANAVLRRAALEDIASDVVDRRTGLAHKRYIQDRTVIEDTESSVDLVDRGWQLMNYPARLSYSATPPDFGALIVQRRRWANGGLLILPKLMRLLLRRRARGVGPLHGFMRTHYLISIAAVNAGLVVLFAVPFAPWYANVWLPLTALPYFLLYTRDLRLCGYRRHEVLKVYALNLLLLPVNLGGVLNSLQQAITRRPTPFKRTPKVSGRTAAPPTYIVLPAMLALALAFGAAWSLDAGRLLQGSASLLNSLMLVYAIHAFVGLRHAWQDLAAQVRLRRARSLTRLARAVAQRARIVRRTNTLPASAD